MQTQRVWVLASVKGYDVAVLASHVREMVSLDGYVAERNHSKAVRGLLNLRGRILTLLDLRVMLGQRSATVEVDELCSMLEQRKRDHSNWLEALATSIRDSTPFSLARDPAQCAFGRWRASFRTDHALLRLKLEKVDVPHRGIHELADELLALRDSGLEREAIARLEDARNGLLRELMRLLDEAVEVVRKEQREIVLVLDRSGGGVGVIVDSVLGVRAIDDAHIDVVEPGTLGEVESFLFGFTRLDNQNVLLLDLERLVMPLGTAGQENA